MSAVVLREADFRRQPWRNGGGTTTELARHDGGERFLWRLSIAEVERSGPFSDFAGYERVLMLLDGAGMELDIGGEATLRVDRAHEPFAFDGGAPTECRLIAGPVRDLNLIVDRERARGALAAHSLHDDTPLTTADWTLVLCLAGAAAIAAGGETHALAAGELLRLDACPGALARPAAPATRLVVATLRKDGV